MTQLGDNVRRLREAAGMSRHRLHVMSELDSKIISAVEDGVRNPSYYSLCQICKALKCTPDDLIPVEDYTEVK